MVVPNQSCANQSWTNHLSEVQFSRWRGEWVSEWVRMVGLIWLMISWGTDRFSDHHKYSHAMEINGMKYHEITKTQPAFDAVLEASWAMIICYLTPAVHLALAVSNINPWLQLAWLEKLPIAEVKRWNPEEIRKKWSEAQLLTLGLLVDVDVGTGSCVFDHFTWWWMLVNDVMDLINCS